MKIHESLKKLGLLVFIMLSLSSYNFADSIQNLQVSPSTVSPGQNITITFQFMGTNTGCKTAYFAGISNQSTLQNDGTAGQLLLVSEAGMDVVNNSVNGGRTSQCNGDNNWHNNTDASCGMEPGGAPIYMTVPTTWTTPGTYYALVAVRSCNLYANPGLAIDTQASVPFTLFVPPPPQDSIAVTKTAEGTLALPGDLVLYSIDYQYGNNTTAPTITDSIPVPTTGSFAFVSAGPSPVGGNITTPAVGATSGTVTWTFPTSTYMTSGTVWMLLSMTSAINSGTVITNTATGTSGPNVSTSVTSTTVESVSMSLIKTSSLNGSLPNSLPDTVTYTLNYNINEGDYSLEAVRTFDDIATGTYSATPPNGWEFLPNNGTNGTWVVSSPNNNGDNIITGNVPASGDYPALLLDNPGNTDTVQFCDGIIESDVYINEGNYNGSDALVIIRSNGMQGNGQYAYGLLLSVDTSPAYLSIQKNDGANGPSWNAGTNALTINNLQWYRVKIYVTNNGFTFNAYVWQLPGTQPALPTISWTDTPSAADLPNVSCNGTNTNWRPGIGEQGGGSTTQDSYNNFKALPAREIANAVLYDTIPTGLTYASSSPAGTTAGNLVSWSLGEISNTSGSYTWWATAANCGSFTNTAVLNGVAWCNNPIPLTSNQVEFDISCGTMTFTPTPTPYQSPTFTTTPTITPTSTITPTYTPTPEPFNFHHKAVYPNPAEPGAPGVYIDYDLSVVADVTAKFYTISGEYIGSVENSNAQPGTDQTLLWNLKNSYGNDVASGIYIFSIEAVASNGKKKEFGKIAVMK